MPDRFRPYPTHTRRRDRGAGLVLTPAACYTVSVNDSPRMRAFKTRMARLARYRTQRNVAIVDALQAGHPAAEIGRHYQITSERVRQIGKAAR